MSAQPVPKTSRGFAEAPASLDEVLITHKLSSRPHRRPQTVSENQALHALAGVMGDAPEKLPDTLLQSALELCHAGTAGLSLLEPPPGGEQILRWTHSAGMLKHNVGGTVPRKFSPCGTTLERGSAQLFSHPGRHFTYLEFPLPIVEALVVPLSGANSPGAIWIVSHDEKIRFETEDVRILSSLGEFTSSALRMIQLLESEKRARYQAEKEITKCKEAEAGLRESEEFIRRILESSSDVINVIDLDFQITYRSPVAKTVMDYDNVLLRHSDNWLECWLPSDRPTVQQALDRALAGGSGSFHAFCPTLTGTPKWWDVTVTPIKNEKREVVKLLSTSRDVTGRKHADEALKRAHEQLEQQVRERTAELQEQVAERRRAEKNLRDLTGRLLRLRDDEQRRLARELHDSVGQMLAAISMNSSAIIADQSLTPQSRNAVTQNAELIKQISNEIRTISHLLHPPLLDEVGLVSGVRWYLEGFAERSNMKVKLECDDPFGRLPREMETALFRLVQESLTNVHRHSKSATAKVCLARTPDEVTLEVSDEGVGIPQEKIWEIEIGGAPGVGLSGMRERVLQLGGKFEIRSNTRGTVLSAKLSLSEVSA